MKFEQAEPGTSTSTEKSSPAVRSKLESRTAVAVAQCASSSNGLPGFASIEASTSTDEEGLASSGGCVIVEGQGRAAAQNEPPAANRRTYCKRISTKQPSVNLAQILRANSGDCKACVCAGCNICARCGPFETSASTLRCTAVCFFVVVIAVFGHHFSETLSSAQVLHGLPDRRKKGARTPRMNSANQLATANEFLCLRYHYDGEFLPDRFHFDGLEQAGSFIGGREKRKHTGELSEASAGPGRGGYKGTLGHGCRIHHHERPLQNCIDWPRPKTGAAPVFGNCQAHRVV